MCKGIANTQQTKETKKMDSDVDVSVSSTKISGWSGLKSVCMGGNK